MSLPLQGEIEPASLGRAAARALSTNANSTSGVHRCPTNVSTCSSDVHGCWSACALAATMSASALVCSASVSGRRPNEDGRPGIGLRNCDKTGITHRVDVEHASPRTVGTHTRRTSG